VVEGEEIRQHFVFLRDWEKKVHAIANGLPERAISPSIAPKVYDACEPFRLLYLSNMLETKGYWDVLVAVRILIRERNRNVTCRFVGQWLSAPDCRRFPTAESARVAFGAYVDKHHLGGSATHEAPLLGASKLSAFMEANAFLLPSNYINEGQPVSILEAMAYGLVVIACRHRLIPTMVVNEHTGFLVEYGSPSQIADRVEFLLDNPALYHQMSINAIKRFAERFTADVYVDRLANVIRGVST
jgi:glycosyltransferase involved in cell wall biosynthesis